ncbi:ImmA/IrrE family metallo-endopeptidase [Nocardioides sp.]|uniref:ImmA/IrrE family metallo-endopeptidase n=1 Tax=Nocardioides sp. TaxID=35761 RepID=UPI0027287489|nr:ImmA/IrrE family metallo-endopeptidase [Nocardioides sp.]MDO9455250.1 ImmA/IrrE family metallo-endopeptidase [Nocardioides sp.]
MREVAQEERAGLGLADDEPLDPHALAAEHGIPVYSLTDLLEQDLPPETHEHFQTAATDAWSAALVPLGAARIIVENDAHAQVRRRSNIAHELGHHFLEHEFDAVILGSDHRRQFNPEHEKQATFMSGELLIPEQAARQAAKQGWDDQQVASRFQVSTQFAQMRMAGARVIAARTAKKYGRP